MPFKLLILFAFLLAADQISKFLVRAWMHPLETVDVVSVLHFEYVRNRGIAFGLLDGYGSIIIPVGIIVLVVIIMATLIMRDQKGVTWPLALLLAGAAGNLIDRLLFGSVTDFIRLPHWPAFNLADIFIVSGVVLLLYGLMVHGGAKSDKAGVS
jgi:signal peptidase II